jgi:hypothetical protein
VGLGSESRTNQTLADNYYQLRTVKAVRGNTNSLYGGGKARNLAGSAVLWSSQYRMVLSKQTNTRGSQKCSLMMQATGLRVCSVDASLVFIRHKLFL